MKTTKHKKITKRLTSGARAKCQREILVGDNRETLKSLPSNSVDSIVTDPPYEYGYHGHKWDKSGIAHDLTLWRECLRVLKPGGYLLAFSACRTQHRMVCSIEDVGFGIRDQIGWMFGQGVPKKYSVAEAVRKYAGDAAARPFVGSDIALKPGWEPICVARKPLEGTIAENALKYGVGGLNIEACRLDSCGKTSGGKMPKGRWPANLCHDGSTVVLSQFPSDEKAEFFYCPKATKADRSEGTEGLGNAHPTVKPTELMRYLCRLVTPVGGLILDPFLGSGSTGKAAILEGFRFIGCELSVEYAAIAAARIKWAKAQMRGASK